MQSQNLIDKFFPKFYLLQGRYLLWRLIILATSNQGCNMPKPSVWPHPDQHQLCYLLNFNYVQYAICALLLPWQLLSFIMIINIHVISYSPNYSLRTFLPCIAHIIFQNTMINIPRMIFMIIIIISVNDQYSYTHQIAADVPSYPWLVVQELGIFALHLTCSYHGRWWLALSLSLSLSSSCLLIPWQVVISTIIIIIVIFILLAHTMAGSDKHYNNHYRYLLLTCSYHGR